MAGILMMNVRTMSAAAKLNIMLSLRNSMLASFFLFQSDLVRWKDLFSVCVRIPDGVFVSKRFSLTLYTRVLRTGFKCFFYFIFHAGKILDIPSGRCYNVDRIDLLFLH